MRGWDLGYLIATLYFHLSSCQRPYSAPSLLTPVWVPGPRCTALVTLGAYVQQRKWRKWPEVKIRWPRAMCPSSFKAARPTSSMLHALSTLRTASDLLVLASFRLGRFLARSCHWSAHEESVSLQSRREACQGVGSCHEMNGKVPPMLVCSVSSRKTRKHLINTQASGNPPFTTHPSLPLPGERHWDSAASVSFSRTRAGRWRKIKGRSRHSRCWVPYLQKRRSVTFTSALVKLGQTKSIFVGQPGQRLLRMLLQRASFLNGQGETLDSVSKREQEEFKNKGGRQVASILKRVARHGGAADDGLCYVTGHGGA